MNTGRLLTRLAHIGCGASLGLLSLAAGTALLFYLVDTWPTLRLPVFLAIVLALVILLALLPLALRLLVGRQRPDGGLFPPWGLRIVAAVYFALPLAALVAGQWREFPLGALLLQGAAYVFIGLVLFRLASNREKLPGRRP